MTTSKFNPTTLLVLLFTIIVASLRVLFIYDNEISPLSNFSPLGAMALFGGACFNRQWKAFSFPLFTLFIGDVFLSFTVFREFRSGLLYQDWYWTYGAFFLMTLTGRMMIKKPSVLSVLTASVVCVLIHWIVSDVGVWLHGTLYLKTFMGYMECLAAALPYEGNLLLGTVLYAGILFGSFSWIQQKQSTVSVQH